MQHFALPAVTCAAILIASCSAGTEEPPAAQSGNDDTPAAADTAASAVGARSAEEGVPSHSASANSSSGLPDSKDSVVQETIPPAFRGRWGETPGACARPVEDRGGVMTVTSSELHFNELRATATKVTVRSPTRVSINAHVAEPARDFTFFTDLVLHGAGKRLVREEEGPRQSYVRCLRDSGRLD